MQLLTEPKTMFSTISSFLPNALSLTHSDKKQSENPTDSTQPDESTSAQPPPPKKKPKPPPLNETFVVVRPPPAVSNHPLNLQLQLVPPAGNRQASTASTASLARASVDSIVRPDLTGSTTDLTQNPSAPPSPSSDKTSYALPNRSVTDISLYTSNSSASLSSVTTNASSSSAIRRIVPLYNLHAHNVMQNTVLDAGTDAKVAKFLKKGLEIVDLTFLEVFEIWGNGIEIPKTQLARLQFITTLASVQTNPLSADPGLGSPMVGVNKRASIASFNSSSIHSMLGNDTSADTQYLAPSTTPRLEDALDPNDPNMKKGAKKFFGRMFKKKEGMSPALNSPHLTVPNSAGLSSRTPLTPASSRGSSSTHSLSGKGSEDTPTPIATPAPKSAMPPNTSNVAPLCPPVLDLQATLVRLPSHAQPNAKATHYIWIIRKWLKKSRIDSLKGLMTAASDQVQKLNMTAGNNPMHDAFESVEIWFEWRRSNKRRVKRGRTETRPEDGDTGTREPSRASRRDRPVSSILDGVGGNDQVKVVTTSPNEIETFENGGGRRISPDRDSITTGGGGVVDDDDESDPEDSDTPWNCTMVIHRLHNESHHHHRGLLMRSFGHGSQTSSASATQLNFPDTPQKGHKKSLSFSMSTRSGSGSNSLLTPTLQSAHLQSASETTPKSSALSPPASSSHGNLVESPAPLETPTEEPPQRLKIATLHPAPHHPKIVAQLKVPFPLPDIDLSTAVVRRRKAQKPAEEKERHHREHDQILSAEEIKDIICTTSFWLIVRQGFGGVGKEKRKGDGWRIRA